MSVIAEVGKGLGNLDAAQRQEIYRDLRSTLNISESAPMLPLPPAELAAWARAASELLAEAMAKHPSTRAMASVAAIEPLLLQYGQPADDAFLDSQLAIGPALRAAGFSGLYIHAWLNSAALSCARKAARAVLPEASAALVEERYPVVVLLRHALMQESFLGISGVKPAA